MGVRGRRTADPTLKKATCYTISHFDAGYTGTDFDDFPSAVRERHDTRLSRHSVGAQGNCQVAKIERAGRDLDQDLARAWLWRRKIDLDESVDAARLRQLIRTHFAPRSPGSSCSMFVGLRLKEATCIPTSLCTAHPTDWRRFAECDQPHREARSLAGHKIRDPAFRAGE